MSPFENADYTEEVSITSLGGLDFTNMANNEIIRKTSDTTAEGSGTTIQDEVAGEFYIKKIFNFINVPPFNILLGGILNSYNILTSSYKTQIAPKSSSIGSSQGLFLTSTVLDGNIKVGINKSDPEEELEIDGNIQIDSGDQARLKFQKSGGSPHALGEIDGEQDGTNGGTLEFYTKVDGGGVTEKLRINNKGAIGVGGANFGNDGQFLMSKGNAAVPVWSNTNIDTTITSGSTNPVTNNAIFNALSLKVTFSNSFMRDDATVGALGYEGYLRVRNTASNPTIFLAGNTGRIDAASFHPYSDDRIKSHSVDISNATEILMKLKPIKYQKHISLRVPIGVEDTDLSSVPHVTETGFNAQDVQNIPELSFLVNHNETNDLLSLNYTDLIAFLTKSVQELNERIKILENK